MAKKQAIIIGAGIGGLATAARLGAKNIEVRVYEANGYPGGKLTQITLGDYRFDAGPSLFTMPDWLKAVFTRAGKRLDDYFSYISLEETTRYFWESGLRFNAPSDADNFIVKGAETFGVKPELIKAYLDKSKNRYETVGSLFLDRPMHLISTYLNPKAFKAYARLPFLGLWGTMAGENESFFGNSELAQLFNRYATYNGSDAWQAPALMNLIPHLELGIGAYYPKGGMHSITLALYKLCLDLGVKFYFNSPVDEIIVTNSRATAIRIDKDIFKADWIVSNLDVAHTYGKLLPGIEGPKRVLKQPRSSSALIFYWGIKSNFPELGLHNILFSKDYKKEFEKIFKEDAIFNDPTVYINITSKHTPSDAPSNCENWFVMINVPANKGQNWEVLIKEARINIIEKIDRVLGVKLSNLIVVESVLSPVSIEQKTGSFQGALYGNASNNRMAAFLRHANKSFKIKGLYLVGGSVHPGGGIPLALQSGKIAVDLMQDDGLLC